MTKEEFEAYYAAGSKASIERLRELGLVAMACDCGEEDCQGWQMTRNRASLLELNDGLSITNI